MANLLIGPPEAGNETDTLLGSLERQRRTFAWKTSGLDASGMRATVGVSTMTLGGLVKHLALVEEHYFSWRLWARPPAAPFAAVNWDADPDWEWRTSADDSPEELTSLWEQCCARSRASVTEALAGAGLDMLGPDAGSDWRPSLRRTVVDLIEEYARHVGHADLIRESVDGLTGEDPPAPAESV